MRNEILCALLLLSALATRAEDMRDGSHIFNYDVTLHTCALDGTNLPAPVSATKTIMRNTRFEIRTTIGANYIIRIITFTGTNAATLNRDFVRVPAIAAVAAAAGVPAAPAVDEIEIFFKLPVADYPNYAQRFEKRGNFTVGASTTLIKVRPGSKKPKDGYNIYSEFGNDFNIGVSAGWKWKPYRRLELAHSFVGGLSFSDIKATPYTTKNYLTAEANQACITFSIGYLFEYNKFQLSIFSGLDVMSGEVGRNWIYRNRPWIGLGFGFQIFRAQGETSNVGP